jgi:hypothetical protein
MLSCSIWFSAPSFWKGGGLESHCAGRGYGLDGAVRLSRLCGLDGAVRLSRVYGLDGAVRLSRVYGLDGAVRLSRVYSADGAVHGTIRTVHTTYAVALRTTTNPKTRCRKPYAATQHLVFQMMGICARNMSS